MELVSRKAAMAAGIKRYYTGEPCKNGHIAERSTANFGCLTCTSEKRKKHYHINIAREREKSRILASTERYKEKKRIRRSDPEKRRAELDAARKRRNPSYTPKRQRFSVDASLPEAERKRIYARIYYHENKDKIRKISNKRAGKRKEYIRKWQREFNKTEEGRAIAFMRKCIYRCLSNKTDRTYSLLGYSAEELANSIREKFLDGMTWENHGQWHIDHIKPISAFIKDGINCPKIINSLDNLQPLWAQENLSKGAKYNDA